MVTFRNNNNRRVRFRSNDRNIKRNGEGLKYKSDFSSNANFQRRVPGRNNHNASKLVEKYNDLAREALANEDKILSENYFQYADHFIRVLNEKEKSFTNNVNNNFDKNKNVIKPEEKENNQINSEENKVTEKQPLSS
jgi:hypothetical protein